MTPLYPFAFRPLLRRYLWGGRKLGTELGKEIGPEADYAESWEICDRGQDQSVVIEGPLAGTTLSELTRRRGDELLGPHAPKDRFPLLFKFLDAQRTLSVQVHPDDVAAARLTPPDLGKTEAWVILDAAPGGSIYAGFKRGFDRAAVERELARGVVELCLHRFEPRANDVVFLPAGAIHALGAGVLVAEIQQSSDATFRLFDWNRVGPDGKPRALHIPQALDAIDFSLGPIGPVSLGRETFPGEWERLVTCDYFILDRRTAKQAFSMGGDGLCRILAVIQGEVIVDSETLLQTGRRGATFLLPTCLKPVTIRPRGSATLLSIRLP